MCAPDGSEQAAAEAGVIEAVVVALRTHPKVAGVQEQGCVALTGVCYGDDAAGRARKQRLTQAGGRAIASAAMQAHPGHSQVHRHGQMLLDALSA